MRRRHFIGQNVLVSAILDSKVHRRRAYQPAEQHSPKRRRDIAIGGEDGSALWIGVGARNRSPRNLDPRSMQETYPTYIVKSYGVTGGERKPSRRLDDTKNLADFALDLYYPTLQQIVLYSLY